jgi:hypothetical protein
LIKFGQVYQLLKYKDSVILKNYKNGELVNGGNFNTAILKIILKPNDTIEKHYLNPDKTYNLTLPYQILRKHKTNAHKIISQYYDEEMNVIEYKGVYKRVSEYLSSNQLITSFYTESNKGISHSNGMFFERKKLDSLSRITLVESLGKDMLYCVDKSDFSSAISYSYDEHHNIKHKTLYNPYGKKAKHVNQYNITYTYDDLGNIQELNVLDENDKNREDNDGVSIYKYWSDLRDNIILIKRYNSKAYPILGSYDYFKSVQDYDEQNRILFEGQYYFENRLIFSDSDKWGATKYEYQGDSIELRYNIDVYNDHFNDDTGIATVKNYLNKKNLSDKIQYLDDKGNFAKTKDEIVQYAYEYDKNWNMISETTLDSLGIKVPFENDVAKVKWEFNKDDIKIKTTYFTKNDELAKGENNVSYNFFVINDKNLVKEIQYFDNAMKPVELDGVHIKKYVHNRFGKDSIIKLYSKFNKLKSGVAVIKYMYNWYSTLIEESYFNKNNQLTKDLNGISYKRFLMNDEQQITGYKFYDSKFRKVNNNKGYHYEKIILDNYNYIVENSFYDRRQKPAVNSDDFHKIVYKRDSLGELLNFKQLNIYDKLTEDNYGVAETRYERAKSGMIKTIRNYDSKGNLANDMEGVAETYYISYLNGLYYLDKEIDKNGIEIKEAE